MSKTSKVTKIEAPILLTTNYDAFTSVLGNRPVNPGHVKKLVRSYSLNKNKDLYLSRPVLVNEKYEVIDGQHRIAAFKILGLAVPYVIVADTGVELVREINSAQEDWKLINYIESFIKEGNEHYIELMDFSSKHDLPPLLAARLLGETKWATSVSRMLKSGAFQIKNLPQAEEVVAAISSFRPHTVRQIWRSTLLVEQVKKLISLGIDWERMENKLQTCPDRIVFCDRAGDYLHVLETIYNYDIARGTKVRFY